MTNKVCYNIHSNPKGAFEWISDLGAEYGKVVYSIEDNDYQLSCVYTFESTGTMLIFKLIFG